MKKITRVNNNNYNNFFFIITRGRSGSTMLRAMLSAHPLISIPPDSLFIINLYAKYKNVRWDKDKIIKFYNDLWLEKYMEWWNLDKNKLKVDLLNCPEPVSYSKLCEIVYNNYDRFKRDRSNTIVGDKNPHNTLFLKKIIKIFPGAKFIFLIRDCRDTVLSYQNVKFDINNNIALAYRWNKFNKIALKYFKLYPGNFILLKYEDLLAEPEFQLNRLSTFLGVKFNSAMLEFYKYHPKKVELCQEKTTTPLNKQNARLWERKMKKKDIIYVEYVSRKLLNYFGYKTCTCHKGFKLYVIALPGILYGYAYTLAEQALLLLPLKTRMLILNYFRKKTTYIDFIEFK